jgi:hypothetical protein
MRGEMGVRGVKRGGREKINEERENKEFGLVGGLLNKEKIKENRKGGLPVL